MMELHTLRSTSERSENMEAVDPAFVKDRLLWARDRSWDVFREIKSRITPGLTEEDARKLVMSIFGDHGVHRHWHRPYIRFGPGTALTFRDPIQKEYRLKEGDPVYIDIGPSWTDSNSSLEYEGDVGDTYVLGENKAAEDCAQAARDVFKTLQDEWRSGNLSGKGIYARATVLAQEKGYLLTENIDGHRLSDFPHHKYSKERLANISACPSPNLWVLEIHIRTNRPGQPVIGAFFEDLLM